MYLLRVSVDTNTTYIGPVYQPTLSNGGWNYGVTIKDLRFDGGKRHYHGSALWIEKTEYSAFQNLYMYGFDGPGIYLSIGARQLNFFRITTEFCGAWNKRSGTRNQYADFHIKKWSKGESFEAVNDVKIWDLTSVLPLWKSVEINSGLLPDANSSTRFIKFHTPTCHGFPMLPSVADPYTTFWILRNTFQMSKIEFNEWKAVYDVSQFDVLGDAKDVEIHNGLFPVSGATQPSIHFQNTENATVDNCSFESKIDGIADSSFASIVCDARAANPIGSYTIINNTFNTPVTATNFCVPFRTTATVVGQLIDMGNRYFEFYQHPQIYNTRVLSISTSNLRVSGNGSFANSVTASNFIKSGGLMLNS